MHFLLTFITQFSQNLKFIKELIGKDWRMLKMMA